MLNSAKGWIGIAAVSVFLNAAIAVAFYRTKKRAELLATAREKATLDLQNLQQAFHQFAPQRVVEDVIKRGASTSGETRSVTVLFADIVEFTALSESLNPETLVRILNGYFEAASTAVTRHGGHVAKFIGDGVMAIFGAPESNAWHAMDAVIAAVALRDSIGSYNEELRGEGLPPLDVRIGVHSGNVVAGVVGSRENLEYTVIGDVVNTAARIESLTRKHGVGILISADVRPALDGRFKLRELPPEHVKGKAEPVVSFAVEAFSESQGS
jgi:class 3 adenylate cyclase